MKYPSIKDPQFQIKIKKIFNEYQIKKKKQTLKDFCYPKRFTFQLPQLFVSQFLNPDTPYKRVLLYHRIGAGKTCAAIQIAEKWKKYKQVILVAPASLICNFYKELRSMCTGNEYITVEEKEELDTLSPESKEAHKIIEKVKDKIHKYYDIYSYHKFVDLVDNKKINLKNTLLIVDEVQNIVREGGLFYTTFKKVIDKAPNDFRLVLMSGTPIFDKPAELGLTMNLLSPDLDYNTTEFNKEFLDREVEASGNILYTLKNEDKLAQLLQGYVSYYEGAPAFTFPRMNIKFVKCRMSKFQTDAYRSFAEQEKQGLFLHSDILNLPNDFLLGSRLISNVVYPNKKIGEKGLDSFEGRYLDVDNLEKYSIKFYKIFKKIERCSAPVFVYSYFKEFGGIEDFRKVLEQNGYSNFLEDGRGRKRYAIWSSDETSKEKDLIREIVNSKDNADGSKLKVILGSPAIKEGISLLRFRQVHILEPYWNMSRIDQVIGRVVRFCSHKDLPREEREVDVYIYLTIDKPDEMSIDQQIMSIALRKQELINQFNTVLQKSAIDYYLFNSNL